MKAKQGSPQATKIASEDDKKIRILEAGIDVLRAKGVSSTSMNDIIRESGISKGGVYHYFSSKNDLLLGVCEYFFEKHVGTALQTLESDKDFVGKSALQMIYVLLEQQEDTMDEMTHDMQLFMDLYMEAIHNDNFKKIFNTQYLVLMSILTDLIDEAKRDGDIKPDIEARLLGTAMMAIFDGFGIIRQIVEDSDDFPSYALKAVRILLEGAKTPKSS